MRNYQEKSKISHHEVHEVHGGSLFIKTIHHEPAYAIGYDGQAEGTEKKEESRKKEDEKLRTAGVFQVDV